MQQPRNVIPQEVPDRFADQLREMRDAGDPRLNAVLAAARAKGWRTATLAQVLNLNPTACSKRIERATPATPEAVARHNLLIAADKMSEVGDTRLREELREAAASAFPGNWLNIAHGRLSTMNKDLRPVRTALRAIERATAYTQPERPDISGVEIPDPPARPAAMMNGKQLAREEIDALIALKERAAKVNGATPAEVKPGEKHPLRQASEEYTKRLNDLITKKGFTPYYLARELGVTHRAITSRLERHGYRTPCPSVQGTPSGVYRGRKIGEQAA